MTDGISVTLQTQRYLQLSTPNTNIHQTTTLLISTIITGKIACKPICLYSTYSQVDSLDFCFTRMTLY